MRILVTGGSGFIGTNLSEVLKKEGIDYINIDIAIPKNPTLKDQWKRCDIMNYAEVEQAVKDFRPTAVIHLAAETDTDPSRTLEDYQVNIQGTRNLLDAIRAVGGVDRLIFTSTQFVNQNNKPPQHDEDYAPHTIYGESKITGEQMVRNSNLNLTWTIIRPTNIWGPWHLRYPYEFWKVLAENKYFHPGKQKVIRSYGYVGNVVYQIRKILELPNETVHKKVYYVGDRPIDLYRWVNQFSLYQTGRQVRILPRFFLYSLAVVGDVLRIFKIKFPITTSRYKSMTTDNPAYMDKTIEELGEPPYSLEDGVKQTVEWMRQAHPHLVRIKQDP